MSDGGGVEIQTMATLCIQDIKENTTQKTNKMSNTDPTKGQG